MTLTAYTPFDSQIDRLFSDAVRNMGRQVPEVVLFVWTVWRHR